MSTNSDMADVIRQWSPQYLRSEVARLRSRKEELEAERGLLLAAIGAKNAGHDERADELLQQAKAVTASPPDSEPAEGEGGAHRRHWCGNCGMELKPDELRCPYCGSDDASPQHRDVGDALRARLAGPEAMQGVIERAAERQDRMLERRDAVEQALNRLKDFNDAMYFASPKGHTRAHDVEIVRQTLSRASDEGGVPEAVRRLPEKWRKDQYEGSDRGGIQAGVKLRLADELERAITEQELIPDEAGILNDLAHRQWEWVDSMGWHNKEPLEYVALIAGEIGELANECRGEDGLTEKAGEEIADVILRCIDMAHQYGIEIGREVVEKIDKNARLEKHPKGRVK